MNLGVPQRVAERREKVATTGTGAFTGMVLDGLAALVLGLGPVAVVAAGLVGALIGDQWEYEELKKRRKRLA